MSPQQSNQPTKAEIFAWALRKLGADDYHFTLEGMEGRWELNIWEFEEEDLSADQANVLKEVAQAIVDGRFKPEIALRLASPELPTGKDLSVLFRTPLQAALGYCLLDARRRLGASGAATFETSATQAAPQAVSDSIALGILGEMGAMFTKIIKRADHF